MKVIVLVGLVCALVLPPLWLALGSSETNSGQSEKASAYADEKASSPTAKMNTTNHDGSVPDALTATEEDESNQQIPKSYEMQYSELNGNPDYRDIGMRLSEIRARRDGISIDEQTLLRLMSEENAWQNTEDNSETLEYGQKPVQMDPMRIEILVPGDKVYLPIPQSITPLQAVIEDVEVFSDDVVIWRGKAEQYGEKSLVLFTQTSSTTFASIISPEEGSFVMQVNGNQGWIADEEAMNQGQPLESPCVPTVGEDNNIEIECTNE